MSQVQRDEQIRRVFGAMGTPVVLPKGLVQEVPALARVPRYVAEFLLAREKVPERAVGRVADTVAALHPAPEDRAEWRHRLIQAGSLRLLDEVQVEVDVYSGLYWTRLPSVDLRVLVDPDVLNDHPQLLSGGLWGRCHLSREPNPDPKGSGYVVYLRGFRPVQVKARLEPFLDNRYYFSTQDWIDLLLTSAGYDPETVVDDCVDADQIQRRKLLLLCRLAPVVEPSLHLLELGPRNTGKTYLLRSLSNRVFVLSGARGTPASLFVNLTTRTPGILVTRAVAVFDEVARLNLGTAETLATMKDFLEAGRFTRGGLSFTTACSSLFLGNIDVDRGRPARRYRSLVDPLPFELRDAAFIDRIHGYLPGWELPKMKPESFATGLGFISDYFGEALVRLRGLPFEGAFRKAIAGYDLQPEMTQRDRVAVERIARALVKLVFPHGRTDGPDDAAVVAAILGLAGELRQRVHHALVHLAPGEFQDRAVGFVGAPPSPAVDLREAQVRMVGAHLSTAPGAAYYLDMGPEGMEGAGELKAVEVTALPTPGLHVHADPSVARVARMVFDYLKAHTAALSLPAGWLDDRGLAVQVEGDVRDPDSAALPLLLAMTTALRKITSEKPWVAVGAATLHGRVDPPSDLEARLRSIPYSTQLAAPLGVETLGLGPEQSYLAVADFETVLRGL